MSELMENALAVPIPLLNPNEPEALLVRIHVTEGQPVAHGDLLCSLETTKSAADLTAESDGFIAGLNFQEGQLARAGEVFCFIAPSPAWQPPSTPSTRPQTGAATDVPAGMRITQPALALARQHNLDLSCLPQDSLITENLIRQWITKQAPVSEFPVPVSEFDPTTIIVYGGGGHGKSLIDLLRSNGIYRIVGVIDDSLQPTSQGGPTIMGLPVLGGGDALTGLYAQGVRLAVNAVGGIGNIAIRIKVFQRLVQAGFSCPAVIHPTAFVEPSAALSPGVQIFPHAYVGSEARLGFGCIVNTGAIVSHDCLLEEYTNVSPGAMLAGEVQTGAGTLIGMGATINLQVHIGAGARIGNSAVVKEHVPEKGIVRAGAIWPD